MSDLHALLSDVLAAVLQGNWPLADHAVDVLLSLGGIAIVELPEPDSTRYEGDEHEPVDRLAWRAGNWSASVWEYPEVQLSEAISGFWYTHEPISIKDARALAAALLAAADKAEEIG